MPVSVSLSPSLSFYFHFPYFSLRVWQICLSEWVSQQSGQPREHKLKVLVPVNPGFVNYRLSRHAISNLDVIIMIMIIMIMIIMRTIIMIKSRNHYHELQKSSLASTLQDASVESHYLFKSILFVKQFC